MKQRSNGYMIKESSRKYQKRKTRSIKMGKKAKGIGKLKEVNDPICNLEKHAFFKGVFRILLNEINLCEQKFPKEAGRKEAGKNSFL